MFFMLITYHIISLSITCPSFLDSSLTQSMCYLSVLVAGVLVTLGTTVLMLVPDLNRLKLAESDFTRLGTGSSCSSGADE